MANSDYRFIYTNDDGSISIVTPANNTNLTLDQIKQKIAQVVKQFTLSINLRFLQIEVLETLGLIRSKIVGFGIDMAKAKEIHKTNIRNARAPKLAELDIEFQKAQETSASTTDIVAKKNALRDAPAASGISTATTTDELKAQWDTSILGASPYS